MKIDCIHVHVVVFGLSSKAATLLCGSNRLPEWGFRRSVHRKTSNETVSSGRSREKNSFSSTSDLHHMFPVTLFKLNIWFTKLLMNLLLQEFFFISNLYSWLKSRRFWSVRRGWESRQHRAAIQRKAACLHVQKHSSIFFKQPQSRGATQTHRTHNRKRDTDEHRQRRGAWSREDGGDGRGRSLHSHASSAQR